jgi:DNA-binding PadR family transcriptional regulator
MAGQYSHGTTSQAKTREAQTTLAENAVLGLLAAGELSGYDLNRRAQQSTAMILAPTKSRIYAVLPRLVAAGLVASRRVRQSTRPDKSVYRLTTRGRSALTEWLNDVPSAISRQELALKLFFGALGEPTQLLAQLELFRAANAAELKLLEGLPRRAEPGSAAAVFQDATLDYGFSLDRALDRWVRRTIAAVETLADPSGEPQRNE